MPLAKVCLFILQGIWTLSEVEELDGVFQGSATVNLEVEPLPGQRPSNG